MGNQGVSHGNRSGSCAWSASNWLGVQISALIWFLIIILCSVSSRTLAEPRRERESRAGREFHASRASKYAARYFLLLLRAKFAVYVCMARCVCVCVCVWCAAVYYYFTCAIFCHVPFRLVWFRFGFCFYAFIFSTAFTAPFINNSNWFLLFLATPDSTSSALLIFLVFRCPKVFFAYFFVLCCLLFGRFACDSHVNNWQNSTGKCTKKSQAFVEVMVRNGAYQWLKEVEHKLCCPWTRWPFRGNLSFILLRSLWDFSRVEL